MPLEEITEQEVPDSNLWIRLMSDFTTRKCTKYTKLYWGERGTNNCETLARRWKTTVSGQRLERHKKMLSLQLQPWLTLNDYGHWIPWNVDYRNVLFLSKKKKKSICDFYSSLSYNTFLFYTFIEDIWLSGIISKIAFLRHLLAKIPKYFPLFCN